MVLPVKFDLLCMSLRVCVWVKGDQFTENSTVTQTSLEWFENRTRSWVLSLRKKS